MMFTKYHCAGNDFVITDHMVDVPAICHRRYGVGADGVLVYRGNRFSIFNADGSQAEMCGNGLRCLAHLLSQDFGTTFILHSMHRSHRCNVHGTTVEVELGVPIWNDAIVDTGVPHYVYEGDFALAPEYRKKYNANATCIEASCIRTFERGVEDETYSCGTGAAAVLAFRNKREGITECQVTFKSGNQLFQRYEGESIFQSAEVHPVFTGQWLKNHEPARILL